MIKVTGVDNTASSRNDIGTEKCGSGNFNTEFE